MNSDLITVLSHGFNGQFKLIPKRPGVFTLSLPMYHEDGDMIDMFIAIDENNNLTLSDYGLTLQRLAYDIDLDTENKNKVFNRIVADHKLTDTGGALSYKTMLSTLVSDILHVAQAYTKVGSLKYFKREIIEAMFYELLDEFIFSELLDYNPEKKVLPIKSRDDLEVDYAFHPNGKPVYLMGVRDASKARLSTISYQAFLLDNHKYHGWVVSENFNDLPRKDRERLLYASDKQFTSLEVFKNTAKMFLEKER